MFPPPPPPKRDELHASVDVEKPAKIVITETWATVDQPMTHNKRRRRHLLHQEHAPCHENEIKQDLDQYDSVYIQLESNKRNKLIIGTVYRPPKQQAANDAALYDESTP